MEDYLAWKVDENGDVILCLGFPDTSRKPSISMEMTPSVWDKFVKEVNEINRRIQGIRGA